MSKRTGTLATISDFTKLKLCCYGLRMGSKVKKMNNLLRKELHEPWHSETLWTILVRKPKDQSECLLGDNHIEEK